MSDQSDSIPSFVPPDKHKQYRLWRAASSLKQLSPPQPLGRTVSRRPDDDPKEELNGSILDALCVLSLKCVSLPPSLVGCIGFPTIHSKSSPDDIALANAAASNAFDFVIEGLKQHGVEKLNFNVDPNHAKGIPSQAYFVLHHSEAYGITVNTIAITEMYDTWLQSAGFAQ